MTLDGPSLIRSIFFGAKSSSVCVGQEQYGETKLAKELRNLTTRKRVSDITIIEAGNERKEKQVEESTLTTQQPITRTSSFDSNGDASALLLLSLGVPRVTMKLPNGKGVVPIGGGSCARIGKGIFLGANHVNAMGIGSSDRNPLSGSDVLKDIHDLMKQGAEIWVDFPVPVAPNIFSKSDDLYTRGEVQIVSAKAVILGEDPKNDLAILGLEDPSADIHFPGIPTDKIPLIRMGAETPSTGDLVAKVGHAGCSELTLVSVGEVIVPELTPEQIDKIIDQVERARNSLLNVFGELKKEADIRSVLEAIAQSPRIQLRTFEGKVVTNALANPGDSGGLLIKTKTRELAGTTVLTLNPILNNRIAAGIITGYLLGVQPQHLPIDHLSAYTGVKPALELLDQTVGRQNLYRILDGKGEEVVVSKNEATINRNKHVAVFALRQSLKVELGDAHDVDATLQTRHSITADSPLDINELKDRVSKSRESAGNEKVILEQTNAPPTEEIQVYKLEKHTFANKPTGIEQFDCEATKEKDALNIRIIFTTSGDNEIVEAKIHPSVLQGDTSELIDPHTKKLIEDYINSHPGKGMVILSAIQEVLNKNPQADITALEKKSFIKDLPILKISTKP